jgi:hypothetical protein
MTCDDCHVAWLQNPRRKKALRRRALDQYEAHLPSPLKPYLGTVPLKALSKAMIADAIEKALKALTNELVGFRGLRREDQRVPLPPMAVVILREAMLEARESPFVCPAKGRHTIFVSSVAF